MDLRVAVDLARGVQQQTRPRTMTDLEDVDGPDHRRLHGLHWIGLIMNWRRMTGEMNKFDRPRQVRLEDIMTNDLEVYIVAPIRDVVPATGREIIESEHLVTTPQQGVAEVGAEEADAAREENMREPSQG